MFTNGVSLTNQLLTHQSQAILLLPLNKVFKISILPYSLIINSPILSCDKAKYLGVFTDLHLNFNSLKKNADNKVAWSVGILSELKRFLPSSSLPLCYAFIHPHLLHVYLFEIQPGNLTCQTFKHFRTK